MKLLAPIVLLPLLLLAACGRQEPVADVPTSEQLAAAAKAAADNAAEKAGATEESAAADRNYVNMRHGFSITLPEGWTRNARTSTADGVVSEDPGAGADIRVFWSRNADDKDLQQVVEAINDGSEAVEGDYVSANEYRGTANDGEGNSVAVRLLRKPDGSLVTATFVYPEMLSEQYLAIGQRALDSLRTYEPAVTPPEPAAASNAASNAAN